MRSDTLSGWRPSLHTSAVSRPLQGAVVLHDVFVVWLVIVRSAVVATCGVLLVACLLKVSSVHVKQGLSEKRDGRSIHGAGLRDSLYEVRPRLAQGV